MAPPLIQRGYRTFRRSVIDGNRRLVEDGQPVLETCQDGIPWTMIGPSGVYRYGGVPAFSLLVDWTYPPVCVPLIDGRQFPDGMGEGYVHAAGIEQNWDVAYTGYEPYPYFAPATQYAETTSMDVLSFNTPWSGGSPEPDDCVPVSGKTVIGEAYRRPLWHDPYTDCDLLGYQWIGADRTRVWWVPIFRWFDRVTWIESAETRSFYQACEELGTSRRWYFQMAICTELKRVSWQWDYVAEQWLVTENLHRKTWGQNQVLHMEGPLVPPCDTEGIYMAGAFWNLDIGARLPDASESWEGEVTPVPRVPYFASGAAFTEGIPTGIQNRWIGEGSCEQGYGRYTAQSRFKDITGEYIPWYSLPRSVSGPSCP